MRLIDTCVKVLSVAAVAMAAPAAPEARQAGRPVPFPPAELQGKPVTLQEAIAAMQINSTTLASVAASIVEASGQVSVMAGCRNTIYRRWGTLTAQQRTNYVGAIQCLMRRPRRGIWNGAANLYDEIVWVHAQMNAEIHLSDIFLPWHRYYLYMFRELLRTECNFNGPHPWWKETNNQGNFPASDIFSAQWFGALPQRDGNGNGRCISNGAFQNYRYQGQCIARGENKGITNQVTVQNEEVCHGQQGNSFPQHSFCNERRNHALFHNGFGPTMSNSAISPADPIFFLHHSYVDWQWKRWQNVASWRWSTISGCADRRSPCTPLTRDTWLRSRGLFRDMRVGELLDSEGTTTCYTYDLLV